MDKCCRRAAPRWGTHLATALRVRAMENGFSGGYFRLASYRYGRGSILITTIKGIRDWPEVHAGDEVLAAVILDRLLHNCRARHQGPELPAARPRANAAGATLTMPRPDHRCPTDPADRCSPRPRADGCDAPVALLAPSAPHPERSTCTAEIHLAAAISSRAHHLKENCVKVGVALAHENGCRLTHGQRLAGITRGQPARIENRALRPPSVSGACTAAGSDS